MQAIILFNQLKENSTKNIRMSINVKYKKAATMLLL